MKQRKLDNLRKHAFKKGDPRINRSGRPKSFDQLRALAQEIANEQITDGRGEKITRANAILRQWSMSKEPMLQKAFMEYAFGKVPDKLESDVPLAPIVIMRHAHQSANGNGARSTR